MDPKKSLKKTRTRGLKKTVKNPSVLGFRKKLFKKSKTRGFKTNFFNKSRTRRFKKILKILKIPGQVDLKKYLNKKSFKIQMFWVFEEKKIFKIQEKKIQVS